MPLDELLVALPALFLERVHREADTDRAGVRLFRGSGRARLLRLVHAGSRDQEKGDAQMLHSARCYTDRTRQMGVHTMRCLAVGVVVLLLASAALAADPGRAEGALTIGDT